MERYAIERTPDRGNPWVIDFTINQIRRECINSYCRAFGDQERGKKLYKQHIKQGDIRVVKVSIETLT